MGTQTKEAERQSLRWGRGSNRQAGISHLPLCNQGQNITQPTKPRFGNLQKQQLPCFESVTLIFEYDLGTHTCMWSSVLFAAKYSWRINTFLGVEHIKVHETISYGTGRVSTRERIQRSPEGRSLSWRRLRRLSYSPAVSPRPTNKGLLLASPSFGIRGMMQPIPWTQGTKKCAGAPPSMMRLWGGGRHSSLSYVLNFTAEFIWRKFSSHVARVSWPPPHWVSLERMWSTCPRLKKVGIHL